MRQKSLKILLISSNSYILVELNMCSFESLCSFVVFNMCSFSHFAHHNKTIEILFSRSQHFLFILLATLPNMVLSLISNAQA